VFQPDLQRLFHGILLRRFIAVTAAISHQGKIAFPPRGYNGAEGEEEGVENYFHLSVNPICFISFPETAHCYPADFGGEKY
jgi:hypothetical protein